MKRVSILILQIIICGFLYAQNTSNENVTYDPHDFFTQGFNPPAGNEYRSANGSPGPIIGKTVPGISFMPL